MTELDIRQKEELNLGIDDTSVAFESDKHIKLYNCNGFYVRMFNKSGKKKFTKVSTLPHSGWWIPITTRNTEFSLYDKNGVEKCIVIFPWHRYLKNKNFDEDNQNNLFKVEWVGNLECKISYLKKSYSIWFYTIGFIILCCLFFFYSMN